MMTNAFHMNVKRLAAATAYIGNYDFSTVVPTKLSYGYNFFEY